VVLLAAILWGSASVARAQAPLHEPGPTRGPVDRGHGRVGDELLRLIDRIDRFFAEDTEMRNHSFLGIAPGIRLREGPSVAFKPRLRASIKLPRISKRLGIVLTGRDDDDEALDGGLDDDVNLAAGLQALLFASDETKIRLSVGSRFRPEPDPFVRLRLQWRHNFGRYAIRPSVTPFWELEDGAGERTRLDLDAILTPDWLVRLRSEATYGQDTQGVEFRTSLTHYFATGRRTAWLIHLGMEAHTRAPTCVMRMSVQPALGTSKLSCLAQGGRTRPKTRIVEYRTLVRYRRSLLRKWLFFEIEPGIRFEDADRFDPKPELIFRIEVVFGSLRKMGKFNAHGDAYPRAMLPRSSTSMPSSSRVFGPLPSRRR
jgi:hypothetical protein